MSENFSTCAICVWQFTEVAATASECKILLKILIILCSKVNKLVKASHLVRNDISKGECSPLWNMVWCPLLQGS